MRIRNKGGNIDWFEKMKLVHVQGTLPSLDDFPPAPAAWTGRFGLEPASQYMSASLGYAPSTRKTPTPPLVERIRIAGPPRSAPSCRSLSPAGAGPAPDPPISRTNWRRSSPATARRARLPCRTSSACARTPSPSTATFEPQGQRRRDHRLRPRQGPLRLFAAGRYNKLMSSYADDPYILFVPCSQTPEGYWGIYLTPAQPLAGDRRHLLDALL